MVTRVHHLMGPAEIARLLGVSRQRVTQLTDQPDFPKPTVSLAMGKVWLSSDVRAWAKARGRNLPDGDI